MRQRPIYRPFHGALDDPPLRFVIKFHLAGRPHAGSPVKIAWNRSAARRDKKRGGAANNSDLWLEVRGGRAIPWLARMRALAITMSTICVAVSPTTGCHKRFRTIPICVASAGSRYFKAFAAFGLCCGMRAEGG
jgi:hypothetical protein